MTAASKIWRVHGRQLLLVLLWVTSLHGLEYNVESFDVQPYPFQFLREPEDHFTLSRADVTFACSVITVNGFSNILWYLNNTVIKAGPHHNISNNGQGASTLTIRNVSIEDQGDYHCSISDWKAKTRSRPGRLHVIDNKNASTYNDGNATHYINAIFKSTVILPCHLNLNHSKPTWQQHRLALDSKEVTNKMVLIDENGTMNLVLVNVSKDHNGHYQCQVNESGTIRNGSTFILTVQHSTGSLNHHDSTKSSSQYLLIVPNRCDKSPDDQTVTLQCPITGHPSPVISWYLNGELVNLTDYNITNNVGNNTWIIHGGDPCRLIGYWQCFATNEAGTVHYEIRVLPYGWIDPPGKPTFNVTNFSKNMQDKIFLHANISWSPPQYLGGLNASDIYYQLQAAGYSINTTDTYSEFNSSTGEKTMGITINVRFSNSTIDNMYIPSNVEVKKRYDLSCNAAKFKPLQMMTQCDRIFYVTWSLLPDQLLSTAYLKIKRTGWLMTGNCTVNGVVVKDTVFRNKTYGTNSFKTSKVGEGTSCAYVVRPNYENCDCGMSCQNSFSCAYPNDITSTTTATTIITTIAAATISIATIATAISPTDTIIAITPTATTIMSQTSSIIAIESFTATSTNNVMDTAISFTTMSTLNSFTSILPTVTMFPTSSGNDTSSVALYTITGVLISLLIGSIIVFCIVLYIYRLKRTERYADIQFLKMSQTIKKMKPPLSNNYCSTINIADESVCEMPVNKVKEWIDSSNFKHSGDALRSDSFHSIATSQMFAYICKDDGNNNKHDCSELLPGYIDGTQLDEHLQSVCNDTCIGANQANDSLLSLCVMNKAHLKGINNNHGFYPYCDENAAFETVNPYCDENDAFKSINPDCDESNPYCDENEAFENVNPYYDESNVFNNSLHLSHSKTSLPDYMKEGNYSKDEKLQKKLSSVSLDISQYHPTIPSNLYISKGYHVSSLPELTTPCVFNPIFNETTDNIQIVTEALKSNLTDNHEQKQSTENAMEFCLSIGSSLNTSCELNPNCIEALDNSGYYKPPSGEDNSKYTIQNSASNLSVCSNQSDTSINPSTSDIQRCRLEYIELPSNETKHTYFGSRTRSQISSLSELDIDIDDELCEIIASLNTDKCSTDTPNVDSGYMHPSLSA